MPAPLSMARPEVPARGGDASTSSSSSSSATFPHPHLHHPTADDVAAAIPVNFPSEAAEGYQGHSFRAIVVRICWKRKVLSDVEQIPSHHAE